MNAEVTQWIVADDPNNEAGILLTYEITLDAPHYRVYPSNSLSY